MGAQKHGTNHGGFIYLGEALVLGVRGGQANSPEIKASSWVYPLSWGFEGARLTPQYKGSSSPGYINSPPLYTITPLVPNPIPIDPHPPMTPPLSLVDYPTPPLSPSPTLLLVRLVELPRHLRHPTSFTFNDILHS